MLDGVLRVVVADELRITVGRLQLGDLFGDLDIPFEDAEVRVRDADGSEVVLGTPLELGEESVHVELAHSREGGRTPIAEGAAVRASTIRLDDHRAGRPRRYEAVV